MAFHGWGAGVFERGVVRVQTGQEGETPEQICREAHRHRGESPSTSSEPGELGTAGVWIQGRSPYSMQHVSHPRILQACPQLLFWVAVPFLAGP